MNSSNEVQFSAQVKDLFEQTPANKRAIRYAVADKLMDLLVDNGFTRKFSVFFRIHGDAILQVISVMHSNRDPLKLRIDFQPLYNYLIYRLEWQDQMSAVKTGNGWGGDQIEALFDMPEIRDMPDIDAEIDMVRTHALPLCERVLDTGSYLDFIENRTQIEIRRGWRFCTDHMKRHRFSCELLPMLRIGRYAETKPELEYHIIEKEKIIIEISKKTSVMLAEGYTEEYPLQRRIINSFSEHQRSIIKEWSKCAPGLPMEVDDFYLAFPNMRRIYEEYFLFKRLLKAIITKDISTIEQTINNGIQEAYEMLSRYVKRLNCNQ